jgi:hypothetical protein
MCNGNQELPLSPAPRQGFAALTDNRIQPLRDGVIRSGYADPRTC